MLILLIFLKPLPIAICYNTFFKYFIIKIFKIFQYYYFLYFIFKNNFFSLSLVSCCCPSPYCLLSIASWHPLSPPSSASLSSPTSCRPSPSCSPPYCHMAPPSPPSVPYCHLPPISLLPTPIAISLLSYAVPLLLLCASLPLLAFYHLSSHHPSTCHLPSHYCMLPPSPSCISLLPTSLLATLLRFLYISLHRWGLPSHTAPFLLLHASLHLSPHRCIPPLPPSCTSLYRCMLPPFSFSIHWLW